MLVPKIETLTTQKRILILLIFLSSITFQSTVFADIKESAGEQYRILGYEEQQKGNLNAALTYYTKAIALGVNDAVVLNDIGVLYEQAHFPVKAEQHYLKAISVDRNYLPPYSNLGYLYLNRREKEKAFKYLKIRFERSEAGDPWAEKAKHEIISIYPQYKQIIMKLDAKRLSMEVQEKARQDFVLEVEQFQKHFQRGNDFTRVQKYGEAIREYDVALHLNPNSIKVMEAKQRARIELTKQNVKERSELAIKLLNSGDTLSAKREVQKILTEIPNEPILVSE